MKFVPLEGVREVRSAKRNANSAQERPRTSSKTAKIGHVKLKWALQKENEVRVRDFKVRFEYKKIKSDATRKKHDDDDDDDDDEFLDCEDEVCSGNKNKITLPIVKRKLVASFFVLGFEFNSKLMFIYINL